MPLRFDFGGARYHFRAVGVSERWRANMCGFRRLTQKDMPTPAGTHCRKCGHHRAGEGMAPDFEILEASGNWRGVTTRMGLDRLQNAARLYEE